MPSQTFNNLSDEKKQRVFEAIQEELIRVPFPEMSINKVIKSAGIPRGSFYQYFENKDDAFEYFVSECSKRVKDGIMKRIPSVQGDIFDFAGMLFEEIAKESTEEYKFDIIRHVMPYADIKILVPFSKYVEEMDEDKKILASKALGIGNLDIKDEEELMDIINIIEAVFQNAFPRLICGIDDAETSVNAFRRKLGIIKKATLRKDV